MKKIIIAGVLAGLAITSLALPSQAQTMAGENNFRRSPQPELFAQWGPGGNKDGQGRWMESLDLNDSQKQQLQAIRQKYQDQGKSISEQLRTQQQELRTMLAGNASDAQIRAKHEQISKLRQQMSELRFEGMLETRQVLTPEQRQKFSQLMQERRGDRRGSRGPGNR